MNLKKLQSFTKYFAISLTFSSGPLVNNSVYSPQHGVVMQNMDILPVSHLLCPGAGNIPYTTVSSKTLDTYVFEISQLPGHLE